MSLDFPVTEVTERRPNSESENTKELETKKPSPYSNKKREREEVSKKEQKVTSEFVAEEESEPKIGVFGFKNEKYIWPSGSG